MFKPVIWYTDFPLINKLIHQPFTSALVHFLCYSLAHALSLCSILAVIGCQEPFEDGVANGEEPSAAEEAAALAAKEAKGGSVKFGWVKGVLVSVMFMEKC